MDGFKYKIENYIDSLGSILEEYDNASHSLINLPPNVAWSDKSTHLQTREILRVYYNTFTKIKQRFKIGDIVLNKSLPKSSFFKGYDVQNNQELFEIHSISTNLPIPMYQIKSVDNTRDDVITGQFFGHELTMISKELSKM